ncbi:MAG: PEP-CTERM sorting domain-containing protein [Hylemonella sp.]|nr:PEP-CTERM sorting domain-containing protein [Hylemonella sp.]
MKKLSLLSAVLMASPAIAATPATWTTEIDAATYGVTGTISFNDHGYVGPDGVGANDFQVGSGFDASRIGQIQTVVTKDPDGLTPDPRARVEGDLGIPNPDGLEYPRANMDGQVQFYKWAYTTVGGSTFNNMTIDKAGNYFVAKNDMAFQYYDVFNYKDTAGIRADETRDTYLNFQPYAISDAKGWCGSVLASAPSALERMAGQVTFDFAFDVYLDGNANGSTDPDRFTGTQIVPDFVMRSYGEYSMTVNGVTFTGSAVENNTNPLTGELDSDWQNQVSFLGGGVIPVGVWVLNDGTADVTVVEEGTVGATWHDNSFAGYSFLLRADGTRTLTFAATDWSDYTAAPVPEPQVALMFAVGLGMLGAVGWRRKTSELRTADSGGEV